MAGSAAVSFDRQELPDASCPNCRGRGLSLFYRIDDVPVHSCLLMDTRDEALAYPRGHLWLGFCRACGFITNTRFSPEVHEYSPRYEETQGFSGTFNAFAKSLAQRLIDRHGLRGKTILEIGCGKGEFLTLMCTLADNRGIGFDPAYDPRRGPAERGTAFQAVNHGQDARATEASRIEFIQDFYSEKYANVSADMICCRHSLEHIAPTADFMEMIRRSIGDRADTLVFFDLPDVKRVLTEGAFWDLYYEHCSYFSLGSVARLFRAARFDVTELGLDYDDQYLLITARPADGPTQARLPEEGDMNDLGSAVDRFARVCGERVAMWRRAIDRIASGGGRIVVWGSGSKGVAFLTTLNVTDEVRHAVDINPYRHGKFMPGTGHEIISPESLVGHRPTHVIVMNPVYCAEIQADLDRLGIDAELLPVVGT